MHIMFVFSCPDEIVPPDKLTGPPEVNTKVVAESSSLLYKRLQVWLYYYVSIFLYS